MIMWKVIVIIRNRRKGKGSAGEGFVRVRLRGKEGGKLIRNVK